MPYFEMNDKSGDGVELIVSVYRDEPTVYVQIGDRVSFKNVEVNQEDFVDKLLELFPNLKRVVS